MEPIGIKKSLESLLKKMEIYEAYGKQRAVVIWENVCGKEMGAFSMATNLRGNILYVLVKDHIWANEMSMLELEYLEKYEKLLGPGVVKKIFFQAKPHAFDKKDKKTNGEVPEEFNLDGIELDREENEKIENVLKEITDEETEALARRILTHAAKLERWLVNHGGHKCHGCGVVIEPDITYCPICLRELERRNIKVLFEALERKPWLSYEEAAKTIIPLSYGTYAELKSAKLRVLEEEIAYEMNREKEDIQVNELKMSIITMGMLKSGKPPSKLTDPVLSSCLPEKLFEVYKNS